MILSGLFAPPDSTPFIRWFLIIAAGGPFLVAGVMALVVALTQAPLWLEVGPKLRYCTLLGIRTREWSTVREWGFTDEQSRMPLTSIGGEVVIGTHRILIIRFGRWSEVIVKIRKDVEGEVGTLIALYLSQVRR
jgi:hypothetical protein